MIDNIILCERGEQVTIVCACKNDFCEKAYICLRFMGLDSEQQVYAEFKNICRAPEYALFVKIGNEDLRKEKKG